MLSFNLEEAIDTVPPRIADIPAKPKGFQTDFPVRQHESTLASLKSSDEKSKGNTATAAKMESLLSRWSDRASFPSFMYAISSLKQKQELKQQQQNREMYDKFRQSMQQGQQFAKQQQQQQQQLLVRQQQGNARNTQIPTSNQNSATIFPNDSILVSNEPKTSITAQANQKPKFRKVMKGGVLTTMPINERHPPGRKAVELLSRGEGGSFTNKDKRVELGSGNILDDILARSMRNEAKSNLTRKKAVETTKAVGLKVRGKERVCNKAGESASTCELRNSVGREIITINNVSDCKSNINLSLTTSSSCQEQRKVSNDGSEISQKKYNSNSKGQRDINRLALNVSPSLDKESSESSQLNIPQVNFNLNLQNNLQQFKIVTKVDSSESGQVHKPIVISVEQNSTRLCELNLKFDNVPLQNPENSCKNLPNMNLKIESDEQSNEEAFDNVSKPDVDAESDETNHEKSPDNSRQGSMNQDIIKTDTEMLSPGDLVIEIDSDSELHTRSRRVTKKLRYSSLTSESSDSESEQQCSSFDQIRSLCVDQKTNKSIELNDVFNTAVKDNKQPNAIEPSGSSYHLTNEKEKQASLPPAQNCTVENVDVNADKTMKGKIFEEAHGAGEKKSTRANRRKRRKPLNRKKNEYKKRLKQEQKDERLERRRENYKGRITRSMSHSDVELTQTKINQKRRPSQERPEETAFVHFAQPERTPSLLSMVSDETVDITVAQQELSDQRKKRRGGKKKKKKQPTEWYLRQKRKEKEMLERRKQTQQQTPREPPICAYFRNGKCPKGSTCQFKHEKIKELCGFYASTSKICEKYQDGMCPKMHSEFPCMFFHRKSQCSNGNTCKFSHAPLTDETREILDKYIAAFEERKQSLTTGPVSENAPHPAATIVKPAQENNESSLSSRSNPFAVTNVNTSHPEESTPRDVGCFNVSKPASGFNSTSATLQVRKPVVENPKVKRLCSLSTYKAPPLSSLFSTLQSRAGKDSNKTENVPSASKGFLPGMFKER